MSPLCHQFLKWDEILRNPERSEKILSRVFKPLETKPFCGRTKKSEDLLDVTIQENASDELGHWCFIHCVLTGIFFLGATFLLVVMPQFIFFSIRFKGSEIFIKKTKDVYIIQRQMIDDISFGKDGCWLYLKDCRKFFIPKELNHFEEVKLRLKKLHKKDEGLIPYAGMKQVFGGKREKKR